MSISTLLSPQRIFLDSEIKSKKKLLELIAGTVAEQTDTPQSCLFNGLLERERLGSTGLGHGFAVPHARMADLNQTLGCFIRLKNAVNFEAPDNEPVDLVFAIIIPQEATDEHLKILSSLASVFSRTDVCDAIRRANDAAEVADIIEAAEP
jgi:nitrogen PTS system EIIA component